ncbi:MAG: ribosomal protection-like ABC-F family protein [Paenisporosarcina sp.]
MTVLGKIQNVSVEYGDKTIVQEVSVDITKGSCIGVVGGNGAGKSTILSLLAGEIEARKGFIQWFGGHATTYYFKQSDLGYEDSNSQLENKLSHKWVVPKNRSYRVMSGGERMKKRLSQAFSNHVQLLLLDEPTNHLDQKSLNELIKLVQQFSGTIIVVSHNRYFLDEVATTIWEVENQKVTSYVGNYAAYRLEKDERLKIQTRLYEAQQKKIAKIDDQIASLQNWSSKAHADSTKQEGYKEYFRVKAKKIDTQIRSKRKRLEGELAKEKIEQPLEEKNVSFSIEGNQKQGHRVIESRGVSKVFGEQVLWENASFTIQRGERVALVGPNGCGKSTWLRMLMEEEPYDGELWKTNALSIGYLQQTVDDLPLTMSPEQWFIPQDFETRGQIQTLMSNLGFGKEHWYLPIGSMSMGERLKLKLMAFMIEQKDMLIMDEPTNHLDLPSIEQLEKTLANYPGTILLVTHDSQLMGKLCNKVLLFENEKMKKLEMSYEEWVIHRNESMEDQIILRLETERQAILGELSFIQTKDKRYEELDLRFNELTKQIQALRK